VPTLKLEGSTSTVMVAKQYFHMEGKPNITITNYNCQAQSRKKLPKVCVDNNLQTLPENLLMTDHFKRQEHTGQKQEI
jgi:hypothetical protein